METIIWAAPTVVAVHLVDEVGAGCPDEVALRRSVDHVLGRPAHDPSGQRQVQVVVRRKGTGLQAQVTLTVNGAPAGERVLESGAQECPTLVAAAAFAIALATEPETAMAAGSPPPESVPAPPPEPSLLPPLKPAVLPPEPIPLPPELAVKTAQPPLQWALIVGGQGKIGTTPTANGGPHLGVGIQSDLWNAALTTHWELPRALTFEPGQIKAQRFAGSAEFCLPWKGFGGCATLTAGVLHAESLDFERTDTSLTPIVDMGLRGYGELSLGAILVRTWMGVTRPLIQTALRIDGIDVWQTATMGVSGGLSVRVPLF